jgi:hypothetical protein
MKFIKDFKNYKLNEDAGYGNDYFVDQKVGKSQYYFFKIGEGEDETGLIIKIGKFAKSTVISESERSYGVIHIESITPEDMDDYLVNDSEYRSEEDQTFAIAPDLLNQAFAIVQKAMDNYLEKNPKVTKFYDEMLENLDMSSEEYTSFVTPKIEGWSEGRWSVQSGATQNVLIYMKTSHE